MIKFSIIIPVYNVNNLLAECIDSILSQDYKNYEVILIDDGSTDGSGAICDSYSEEYSFIYCYHQKNQGQAIARNNGLKQCRGDYVIFIDSDDFLPNNCVLSEAEKNTKQLPDIIVIDYQSYNMKDGKIKKVQAAPDSLCKVTVSGKEYLEKVLSPKRGIYKWYPWMYVCNREFIQRIDFSFPPIRRFEDLGCLYNLLIKSQSVKYGHYMGYCYRVGREGATTNTTSVSVEEELLAIAASNIKDVIQRDDLSLTLKKHLANNFSYAFLDALYKANSQEYDNLLKKYLYMADYFIEPKHKVITFLIHIVGIRQTSNLLNTRYAKKRQGQV